MVIEHIKGMTVVGFVGGGWDSKGNQLYSNIQLRDVHGKTFNFQISDEKGLQKHMALVPAGF